MLSSKLVQANCPQREEAGGPKASVKPCWRGRIRGGEDILIREMTAADAPSYREFISSISSEDLRLRFFAAGPGFIAEEERKLSHPNPPGSAAFIAIDTKNRRILGLARLEDDVDMIHSQFAILVRTDVHGHGVGWQLMDYLISQAKTKGLRTLYGDVFTHNKAMLQMCRELGFRSHKVESGIRRVVLDLDTPTAAHSSA